MNNEETESSTAPNGILNQQRLQTIKKKHVPRKIVIQTAGTHSSCNGPELPKNCVILYAHKLYNPYTIVKDMDAKEAIEKTKNLLMENNAKQLNNMLSKGKNGIICGKNIVVLCKYGKHRSRAIAEMIGNSFFDRVCYQHMEDLRSSKPPNNYEVNKWKT
jgi:hypothetical protein